MLLSIHEEYNQVLDDDERTRKDDWFNDLDNKVCTFKKKIDSWLRSAERERKSSKGSSRSSESRKSRHQEVQEYLSLPVQGTTWGSKNSRTHGIGKVN